MGLQDEGGGAAHEPALLLDPRQVFGGLGEQRGPGLRFAAGRRALRGGVPPGGAGGERERGGKDRDNGRTAVQPHG
jgi:hypothetical protein